MNNKTYDKMYEKMDKRNINRILPLSGSMNYVLKLVANSHDDFYVKKYLLGVPVHMTNKYVEEIRKRTEKPVVYDNRNGYVGISKSDSIAEFGIEKAIMKKNTGTHHKFRKIKPIINISHMDNKDILIERFYPRLTEFFTNKLHNYFNSYSKYGVFYIGENDFSDVSTCDLSKIEFEFNIILNAKKYLGLHLPISWTPDSESTDSESIIT